MNENVNHIVPDTWCVERLGDFVISEKGKKPKNISKVKTKTHHLPYVNIQAFEKNIVQEYTDGVGCVICEENDFLMVWDGSRSGYIGKAIKGALGSTLVKINFPGIVNDYAYYFLLSKYLQINTRAKGTGTPHVDPGLLWNYRFPIAPYNEQNRIVEKIEELFSDLDKGTEILEKSQKQLKIYRQAVMHWAFEGRLTKKENFNEGELPKGWRRIKIIDIADVGTGATPLKSNKDYYENGSIAWVTSGALNDEYVREASDFVTEKAINETNLTVYPKNTLLLAMYGEGKTRGKCSELLIEACTNQAIAAIYFDNHDIRIKPYLKYFLLKNYYDIRKLAAGGVQPNLNVGIVKHTEFPIPPTYDEQVEIVQEIERRLSVCDKIEEMIEESLKQSEILRYSILKKAFEGRLVPQNPNDEPASILLQRIKADKEKNKPVKKEREKKPKSRTKMKEKV